MSAFSDVDAADEPKRLIASLDDSARGLASMKHYMAVAHRRLDRPGWILDVGCGAGAEIAVLAHHGIDDVVGIDPSGTMLRETHERTGRPLARAEGERLPFRSGSFTGSWIERVLMHVRDPFAVLAEVVRVVAPGGVLTIFEPDWSSLTVNGRRIPTEWTTHARHPSIGSHVGTMLQQLGCTVLDRVEERSWWTRGQVEAITKRAVSALAPTVEQDDTFEAEMTKVLWVATTDAKGMLAP